MMVLRLPALTAGVLSWRLPVSDAAAVTLFQAAFAARTEAPAKARLEQLLACEPGLALWITVRGFSQHAPAGVAALAEWLLVRPVHEVLAGATSESELAQRQAWSQLVELSVDRARGAARVRQHGPAAGSVVAAAESDQQAYLFGLLSASIEWLNSAGSSISVAECRAGGSCLPGWLLALLDAGPPPAAEQAAPVEFERAGPAPAECQELVRLFPRVFDKLARLEQLEKEFAQQLETEKLAAMYWIAYGASHEINNPLANISTRAQAMLRDEEDPDRKRMLATMNSQALRAHEMINDLMLFANPPELHPTAINVSELLEDAIGEFAAVADEQGTQIHCSLRVADHQLHADSEQLVVAIQALLRNSLQALGSGGSIDVVVDWVPGPDAAGAIQFVVADTGPGISPAARRHAFDPFYSGREAGRGLGMGLPKCWRIVRLHGGRIEVDGNEHGGTTVRVELPCGTGQLPRVDEHKNNGAADPKCLVSD